MQHLFACKPAKDPEHMTLSFATSLSLHEARLLKPLKFTLEVDFRDVVVPLDLYDARAVKYKEKHLNLRAGITGSETAPDAQQPKWELDTEFSFRTFNVTDLRKAYVFLRTIAFEIENTMILKMPLSPYYGFTKNFDVRFDVPKEVANYEQFRRSIMVRER